MVVSSHRLLIRTLLIIGGLNNHPVCADKGMGLFFFMAQPPLLREGGESPSRCPIDLKYTVLKKFVSSRERSVHDLDVFSLIAGFILIVTVLWEAFETIILPRVVRRRFRLTRLYYRSTWRPWSELVTRVRSKSRRERWLSFFGPLSLIGLLAM